LPTHDDTTIYICNDPSILNIDYDGYPNSSDKYGNIYFGIGDQPNNITRQAITDILDKPSIFHVAHIMSLCLQNNNNDRTADVMKSLRYLALCQASESMMIANDKYDKNSCFYHWKKGRLIQMSYDDDKTHTSLFSDDNVNHYKLPETLWWALMMSMLGIFDEQLVNYSSALVAYGIEPTEQELLSYAIRRSQTMRRRLSLYRFTYSSWDEELWLLAVYIHTEYIYTEETKGYINVEKCVENEFPEHYLEDADISLNHDGFNTSNLYIMRGPQIQN
jgi:hypothetical protein